MEKREKNIQLSLLMEMTIKEKTCTKCKRTLPISDFYETGRCSGGIGAYFSQCKKCTAAYNKTQLKNKLINNKRYQRKTKLQAFKKISIDGIPRCSLCGFGDDLDLLHVDHINDDGARDLMKSGKRRRLGIATYQEIKKMTKEDAMKKYQILCPIHNWAKRLGVDGRKYRVIRKDG